MDSASRLKSQLPATTDPAALPLARAVRALSDGVFSGRLVLDRLRQGLCVFDAAQRLVLFNARYAEIYGLAADDLKLGMTLPEVFAMRIASGTPPDHSSDDYAAWHDRIGAETDPARSVVRLRDGRVVEIHHAPRPDGGWVATHDDITARSVAEAALRDKAALLELAQEAAGAGLFDWHLVHGLAHLSPESLRFFNLPEDRTTDVSDAEWSTLMSPEDLIALQAETARATATRTTFRTEFRIPRPDGSDRWVLAIGRVVANPAGEAIRIVGLNIDLTERKRAEERMRDREAALSLSEERLAFALDAGSDGLWDWNIATGDSWFSDRWQTMLGYSAGELRGHIDTWERLVNPEDRPRAATLLTAHFEGRSPSYECEHRLRRKDGSWGWVLARGKVVARDGAGAPLRIVGTHIDIASRKTAEAQIAHMAGHDALTDLPNRRLFHERLQTALADVRGNLGSFAVLCLDLDRFKAVNDRLGHLAGDALLRAVAHRLRGAVRAGDLVARLGGDEFAILLEGALEPAQIAVLAERLIEAVKAPVPIGAQQAEVGLSIGIAVAPCDAGDSDGMLNCADLALYRAKAEGRNTHRFFEPAMDQRTAERRRLEQDLRMALRREEFVLHYQPQVRGATGQTIGFEALVRWQHPTRGLVLPGDFIPLAEETGLIVELGAWVLRTACRDAARWAKPLKIAVNVSPRQFQHSDLADMIAAVLTQTGLAPVRLEIEITESVIINDLARAIGVVRRLKDLGVRISMDDFGTGHSSLATLQVVPFDTIKIDRSFVGKVEESPQAAAIVRAILGLGRSLGMGVLAEGVETPGQRHFLTAEGCDEMQGFLFGAPQPMARFAALFTDDATCQEGAFLPPASEFQPPRRRPKLAAESP